MRHDITLDGDGVRLIPLDEANDAAVALAGSDPAVWQFTFQENPFTSRAAARAWLLEALEAPDVAAFAVVDKRTGQVAGTTRYLDIDRRNRKLEIGLTYYAPRFWRTHVNTECKFLLLRYAFEDLGMVRVQFKAE